MQNHDDASSTGHQLAVLTILLRIENLKDAIRRFEEGEVNLREAWRQILIVTDTRTAA